MKIDVTSIAAGQLFDALRAFNVAPEVFDAFVITVTKWNTFSIIAVGAFGTFSIIFTKVVVLAEEIDTFHAMVALIVDVAFCMQHALAVVAEMLVGTVRVAEAFIIVDAFAIFTIVLIGTFVVVGASFVIDAEIVRANKVHGTLLVTVAVTVVRSARFVHAFPTPALFIAVAGSSTLTLVITQIHGFVAKSVTGALGTVGAVRATTQLSLFYDAAIEVAFSLCSKVVDFRKCPGVTSGQGRRHEEDHEIGADHFHSNFYFSTTRE